MKSPPLLLHPEHRHDLPSTSQATSPAAPAIDRHAQHFWASRLQVLATASGSLTALLPTNNDVACLMVPAPLLAFVELAMETYLGDVKDLPRASTWQNKYDARIMQVKRRRVSKYVTLRGRRLEYHGSKAPAVRQQCARWQAHRPSHD